MNNRPWYTIVGMFLGGLALIFLVGLFLCTVSSILPPFVIAFGIAFLLDPLIDRLECRALPRILAVTIVFVIFMATFVLSIVFLLPKIIDQATQLVKDFPTYSSSFKGVVSDFLDKHHDMLTRFHLPTSLQEILSTFGNQLNDRLKQEIPKVGTWLINSLSMVPWIILIPLISFYFLNDLARIRRKTLLFIPSAYREETSNVLTRMGNVFSAYVRGLTVVCLLYGIAVTIVLMLWKLKYGIILGMLAGILYAVPYLGSITTAVLVFLVSVATFPSPSVIHALYTMGSVLVTNQGFDLVITPRILGKSVGLHPILSLFALLAGGKLFGLAGIILAVPLAASIQEVVFEFYPELRKDPLTGEDRKPRRQFPRLKQRISKSEAR